jgi:hypothetical protein
VGATIDRSGILLLALSAPSDSSSASTVDGEMENAAPAMPSKKAQQVYRFHGRRSH